MASILGTPTTATGANNSPTAAHTVGSGNNRCTYIDVVLQADTQTITTVNNFGGVTPQLVGQYLNIHRYRAVNPAVGATTASFVASASNDWTIHVFSAQDVDQLDPDDAIVTNTVTPSGPIEATVSSASNDLVLACAMLIGTNIAASGGATLATEQESIQGGFRSAAQVYEAGAASVTLGADGTDEDGDHIILAMNIRNAATAAANVGQPWQQKGAMGAMVSM